MKLSCQTCGGVWEREAAAVNELTCQCGGRLMPQEASLEFGLSEKDLLSLPYPVALTARRLAQAIEAGRDVLRCLFLVKDCFETAIRFSASVLLADSLRSPECSAEEQGPLVEQMVQPPLGAWVHHLNVQGRRLWARAEPGCLLAALFLQEVTGGKRGKLTLKATPLLQTCVDFVTYRNDTLGHGAIHADEDYDCNLRDWLPQLADLLRGLGTFAPRWRLCLPVAADRCQIWMGPSPSSCTESGRFDRAQVGHFILRGPAAEANLDLFPFLCCLPRSASEHCLYFHDGLCPAHGSMMARLLEFDRGSREVRHEPIVAWEETFERKRVREAYDLYRRRIEELEGLVFSRPPCPDLVGRRFVLAEINRFLQSGDRGLLVLRGEPGRGKTAVLTWMVDEQERLGECPVNFFYRRTEGRTDPDLCVRSLHVALAEVHGLAGRARKRRLDPEASFAAFESLLREIAALLGTGRRQVVFIDALDEAEPTATGRTALQRIPEHLPTGVYVIATTRRGEDRGQVLARQHASWYDLESPDLAMDHARDAAEFVQRELPEVLPETQAEIARLGAGNFLVLELLCGHLGEDHRPDQVAHLQRRLAAAGTQALRLACIYEDFWRRLHERLALADFCLVRDVAGLLAEAQAPLDEELLSGALGKGPDDLRRALELLGEYVRRIPSEEEPAGVRYRIYHESFAEYLRTRLRDEGVPSLNRLAAFCRSGVDLPTGYARTYAIRFAPTHLRLAARWDQLGLLLQDRRFLEAKVEADMIYELVQDFARARGAWLANLPEPPFLRLLAQAIRRRADFLERHPEALFQCLWNDGWWYDHQDAIQHYLPLPWEQAAWETPGPKFSGYLEDWRAAKEREPGSCWLRSLRPPLFPLGTPQRGVMSAGDVTVLAASPDGRQALSGTWDNGHVKVWTVETGKCLGQSPFGVNAVAAVFTPHGRPLVAAERDGGLDLIDADTWDQIPLFGGEDTGEDETHRAYFGGVNFSPDGCRLAFSKGDGFLDIWEITSGPTLSGQRKTRLRIQHNPITVRFSPHGDRVALGSEDGQIALWALEPERELWHREGLNRSVSGLAFSPDGRVLASAEDTIICLRDAGTGEEVGLPLECVTDFVNGLAFSADGRFLAFAEDAHTVKVWDMAARSICAWFYGHEGPVQCVAFASDNCLLSGGSDNSVRVWDLQQGKDDLQQKGDVPRLPDPIWRITALTLSSNGSVAATGSEDGALRLWDTTSGCPSLWLAGHTGCVGSIVFSPDGRRFASMGTPLSSSPGEKIDRTVRVWDVGTGAQLAVLPTEEVLRELHFSPDSRALILRVEGDLYNLTPVDRRESRTRRVWLEQNGGYTDMTAEAGEITPAEPIQPAGPWEAVSDGEETEIRSRQSGRAVAWFPAVLNLVAAHPSGRLWAGANQDRFYLIQLEGPGSAPESPSA